jgi:uncharacterized integral membrane protein (TIGR00697 family)
MDTQLITPFIEILQSLSAEMVSCILLSVCVIAVLVLFRLFGAPGLYLYNTVAMLAANIQVLRGAQFSFDTEPVALGTVVFATTYLCSDLLTEHYGKESAQKGVWYCFAAQILMTLLMIITVGHPPLPTTATDAAEQMLMSEQAMSLLFTPSPRLLFASLIAFAVSQFNDISIYQYLNKLTRGKWLWLRTSVSSLISALIDTVLFSVLAWVILAPQPVSPSTLIFTYILGTFATRAIVSLLTTPIMYLSYLFSPLRLQYVR